MNARFIIGKTLRAALTLWVVVTIAFIALRASGDPVAILLPDDTTDAVVEEFRARWGFDKSLGEQYARYMLGLLSGDLGFSFRDGRRVLDIIVERLPPTLLLAGASLFIAILVGLPAGVAAALHRGRAADRFVMAFSVLGHSLPSFFMGILLILGFAVQLRWLPSAGSETWRHLVLPAVTLGLWNAATIARFVRSSVIDAMSLPSMRTPIANGLPFRYRLFGHILPNAAIPIVTILGLVVGHLMTGAVIIETVFAWPGLGRLTVSAVAAREVSVVQGIVLFAAFVMVTVNLAVDLAYGVLDPRIAQPKGEGRR